ncbi:MAG: carbon monoxide dehydrogenase subunit G [Betaproteobacteria bacterium]|nr:carbon monoxide dehydrogenase subunit G [Betaproteobacteria bacterium]
MSLDMQGEQTLPVGRDELWGLLNDPQVLAKTIPGCNAVERLGEDRYRMGLKLQVANVSGEYMGEVEIRDKRAPEHYVLAVSGEGSIGFMRGEAAFDIEDRGEGESLLRYAGKAEVGGVVAGVGQRVLSGVAKFLVGRFFKALEKHIVDARG